MIKELTCQTGRGSDQILDAFRARLELIEPRRNAVIHADDRQYLYSDYLTLFINSGSELQCRFGSGGRKVLVWISLLLGVLLEFEVTSCSIMPVTSQFANELELVLGSPLEKTGITVLQKLIAEIQDALNALDGEPDPRPVMLADASNRYETASKALLMTDAILAILAQERI